MNNIEAFLDGKTATLKTFNAIATPTQAQINAIVPTLVKVVLAIIYLHHNDPTDPAP
jgi:hypothetical protein